MKTDISDMKIWCMECRQIFSSFDDINIPKHNTNHHIIFAIITNDGPQVIELVSSCIKLVYFEN
jgi:hypothetical protein